MGLHVKPDGGNHCCSASVLDQHVMDASQPHPSMFPAEIIRVFDNCPCHNV